MILLVDKDKRTRMRTRKEKRETRKKKREKRNGKKNEKRKEKREKEERRTSAKFTKHFQLAKRNNKLVQIIHCYIWCKP
jgi:hypothetical protein